MKAWLFFSVPIEKRTYLGNAGYFEDPRHFYRYDSFVPNCKRVSVGDLVVLRDSSSVFGLATIEDISISQGTKDHKRCPFCGNPKRMRIRKNKEPEYHCSHCHRDFETPAITQTTCTLYQAFFGFSFEDSAGEYSIEAVFSTIPRPNKQNAIQEMDLSKLELLMSNRDLGLSVGAYPGKKGEGKEREEPGKTYPEKTLLRIHQKKFERNRTAREKCLAYHGTRCKICSTDYSTLYGPLGEDLVEVHHIVPMSQLPEKYQLDPVKDLLPVCPNCHTVLHRGYPLTFQEIKKMLNIAESLRGDPS